MLSVVFFVETAIFLLEKEKSFTVSNRQNFVQAGVKKKKVKMQRLHYHT